MSDLGGVWRTVGGRRIFIKDGEDLATAMKNSGKFGNKKEKTRKELDEDLILIEEKIREAETEEERKKWKKEKEKIEDEIYERDMEEWDKKLGREKVQSNIISNEKHDNSVEIFSKKIMNQNEESAIVYDDNGNEIMFKDGEKYRVQFKGEELKQLENKNFTHNHPTTSEYDSMFSRRDLEFAYDNKLKSITTINQNGNIKTITKISNERNGFLAGDYEKEKLKFYRQTHSTEETAKYMDEWLTKNAKNYGYEYKSFKIKK